MRRLARWAGFCAGGLAALYLLTALGLASVPAPKLTHPIAEGGASAFPCTESPEIRCFTMRDGVRLAARRTLDAPRPGAAGAFARRDLGPGPETSSGSGTIVLFLHGVLSSGAEPELEEAAHQLRAATGAEVLRLDLRDHGLSASRADPGHVADVDHIGQYDEDVADVLATLRREHPEERIVLAGHSMGGGIALRYAARRDLHAGAEVDGYLLFAPLLGDSSPTARKEPASGAETPSDPVVKVAVPRLIGLAMLTTVRIRGLNGLGTLFFDLPFDLPVRAYTFRAMASMAPDDYRSALKADTKPMLVLVGEKDEAFHAEAYPAVIAQHKNAETVLVSGASHDGVCSDPRSVRAIVSWLAESKLGAQANPSMGSTPASTTRPAAANH